MCESKVSLMPVGVRGMRILDREKFVQKVHVPVIVVTEDKIAKTSKILKNYFFKLENFKPVQDYVSDDCIKKKKIFCHPEKITQWTDISESDRTALKLNEVSEENLFFEDLQLTYDNLKIDIVFKAVLPENEEIVSSFSQIGHIIHLNLKDHLLDYRQLIGQVLLDKIKTCRTVVNKSNIIDNTYRNFKMEVIAGEENFLVTVKENRCQFQFDFSKVYWNPRLGKEHERILSFLKPNDVLFDVFCGVGPFSIPAAKRSTIVFANDLNPDSYKWLEHNATQNKIDKSLITMYNLDGKDFICDIFKQYIIDLCNGTHKLESKAKIHITMNLPALAVEFLKYFNGLIDKQLCENIPKDITVYVYCFAIGEDPVSVAKEMVLTNIGMDISENVIDVFKVRNVSPKKEMMRVTFNLTKEVLCKRVLVESDEPPVKKVCV
ncbi:tRNA (guanine(37)-N1)-methyltransferase [Zerene cesonia]|uniref:tRNA (guanine(37)-N1)-methyltransferase n=1 Tax=Zerene cesonia TaxID=33412 RepID=UPI0018E55E73|nr:tRNA (guanine(37)-N1)-methyltransferase [Zerene cesonia]